jgi:toxin YoeB
VNIQFSPKGWEDYLYWQETDKRTLKKLHELMKDVSRSPYEGIGKPEPLKHALRGFWSRRITDEHRLVYKVEGNVLYVVQARYHYE